MGKALKHFPYKVTIKIKPRRFLQGFILERFATQAISSAISPWELKFATKKPT